MATFKYVAKDIYSKKYKGTIENISSREELIALLRSDHLFLIECSEINENKVKVKLKLRDLSEFCREIGTMLSSGISIMTAMNILLKREKDEKLKGVYKDIYVSLQQGNSFSKTLMNSRVEFPDVMIHMFQASEFSGKMGETALKLSQLFDKDYKSQNKLRGALLYPLILLAITIVVMIVVFTVILPRFFDMFDGVPVPMLTQVMFALSKFMIHHGYLMVIGVLLLVAFLSVLVSLKPVKMKLDCMKLHMPRIGYLYQIIYTSRFARNLSSLYSCGVPMLDSITLAKKMTNNLYIESQFDDVIKNISQGMNLSDAIEKVDGFDSKLYATVQIGEESGKLGQALNDIADNFEYESDIAIEKMMTLLQPLLIIVIGAMVGVIVVSVILPLYSLYGSIG